MADALDEGRDPECTGWQEKDWHAPLGSRTLCVTM